VHREVATERAVVAAIELDPRVLGLRVDDVLDERGLVDAAEDAAMKAGYSYWTIWSQRARCSSLPKTRQRAWSGHPPRRRTSSTASCGKA